MKKCRSLPFWLLGCWLILLGWGLGHDAHGAAEVVSISTGGTDSDGGSFEGSVDATGRYVAFESQASSLVSNDSNFVSDIFLRDRQTGVTMRISGGIGSKEANNGSRGAAISHDGRYVVFASAASNLVPNDTNGNTDIFLYDRAKKKTTRVNLKNGGGQAEGGGARLPAISGDGRYIAYISNAPNLVPNNGDTNNREDLFLYDRTAKKTTRISVRNDGTQVFDEPGFSTPPSLSRDGRYIVYASNSANLVDGDTNTANGGSDVFLYDRKEKTTALVSRNAAGAQVNNFTNSPCISADGSTIAFVSTASNLAGPGGQLQVYTKSLITGAVTKVRPAATYSYSPSLNADGSRVALIAQVGGASDQAEVVDLRTSQIFQPARLPNGADGGFSNTPRLSADGRVVVFETDANGIDPSDFNGLRDVIARPLFDSVAFSKTAYYVSEGSGNAVVTVTREGVLNGAVSVKYAISAGGDTAKPGVDYNPAPKTGTLSWGAGDLSNRTITIPLVNTAAADGYRFFTVSLSGATGGASIKVPVTKVVIRDEESTPVENRIGHRLQLKKIVAVDTNWDTGLFRGLFTIRNPASLPSFAGFIELRFNDVVLANLDFDSVPAKGELVVDGAASVGSFPDGNLVAILYETTPDDGAIKQDSGLAAKYIDNGTAPPSGGTTQPNVGVKSGPPPVTVKTITINGSGTVNEGTFADYTVTVTLSDNTTEANVTPAWQASAFSINGAGRFTAGDVAANKTVTLTAKVLRNGITTTQTRNITVNNVPMAPIITSDLTAFGSRGKSFQYRITARHEPTQFSAANLPDGLTLNPSTGVISGTPTVANTFNVTIQATNNINTDTKTLNLTISEPSPLTVNVVGAGTVTPDLNGELLDVGRPYKLTAKPGTDQLFSGWSGGVVSETSAIAFTMKPNLTVTATFVPNPFLTRAGVYSGLVQSAPLTHEGSGFFTVTIGKSGSCTGKIALDGQSRGFKTTLRPNGTSPVVTLTKAGTDPIIFTLSLDVVGFSGQVTGNLSFGPLSATLEARLKAADTSALAGRYTVLLPGPANPSATGEVPDGSGYATMTVTNKGVAKITGTLGDGTKWSQSAPVGLNNTTPIYVPLYSKKGSIFGPAAFANFIGSDLNAQLAWFKPARLSDSLYPAGWSGGITQELRAARYTAPPVLPGLSAPDANGNAMVQFTGGGLLGSQTQILSLNDNGSGAKIAPVLQSFSFSISASSGSFKGSFFDPDANAKRSFNGVLYQKNPTGAGMFKGASQRTGNVVLTLVP